METKIAAWGLIAATVAACSLQVGAAEEAKPFTPEEIRTILSHGPWPVPVKTDPSNRVSGKAEAIEFGERLFFDQRLSGSGKFACGTCHVPERNWTDNQTLGAAAAAVDRNTPTLMNVRLGRWFGWDGAADSLWAQSMRPFLDARELASSPRKVADLVRKDDQLACRYRNSFGAAPSASDDEAVLVDVSKALAAFVETLGSSSTPFDRFRDALARGEPITPWLYSESAKRGLKIFIGKGTCSTCHSGANFSDGEFHNNGFSARATQARTDPGRAQGLVRVRESRFNLQGQYNDDSTRSTAQKMLAASAVQAKPGEFKVPTLRHLLTTAPYGHHGEFATLAEVVEHYSEQETPGSELKPLRLTREEQSDLVVFLESISTFTNPWRPDEGWRCR
jgi:cytochrome c peroxidase